MIDQLSINIPKYPFFFTPLSRHLGVGGGGDERERWRCKNVMGQRHFHSRFATLIDFVSTVSMLVCLFLILNAPLWSYFLDPVSCEIMCFFAAAISVVGVAVEAKAVFHGM